MRPFISARYHKQILGSSTMHQFHIPVMGTGHTIDSPIRVAPFGIDSVVSIVDDHLIERIRAHYTRLFDIPFIPISRSASDSRAKRITAYLNLMHDIINKKFDDIRTMPFALGNDKAKYFDLLPDSIAIKQLWNKVLGSGIEHIDDESACMLTESMIKGSIDVNIMAKVDRMTYDADGNALGNAFSDACSALRGFALSNLNAAVVLSAGFNPRLYGYIAEFQDFYRDATGDIKKKIILKVSDFRSALVQGKFLAKKGLEVAEFRVESGLNCGGHAFPADGLMLPAILREFREKRNQLREQFEPLIRAYYEQLGRVFVSKPAEPDVKITVQGGVGTYGEMRRLIDDYGVDLVGWGSPFLLVPEATCVDEPTRIQLSEATEKELYLSNVSPLGVPFNNMHGTGSEVWTQARVGTSKSGSPCPKGFLQTNTEFTDVPICTASIEYQALKLDQIEKSDASEIKKADQRQQVYDKTCLCDHLGNGSLISLGILKEDHGKQSICPGPNIAWFKGPYSLLEMADHIYGRTCITSVDRPHVFAKELQIYVDYLGVMLSKADVGDTKQMSKLQTMHTNLMAGVQDIRDLIGATPYPSENIDSLAIYADEQEQRLMEMAERFVVNQD